MRIMVPLLLFVTFTITSSFSQVTYYFSSSGGNDAANGLTQQTAFKSLAKLQSLLPSSKPGDQFLLKRGDVWTTRAGISTAYAGIVGLDLSGIHGNSNNYITIGDYSSGEMPTFKFSGTGAVFQLEGAAFLKVENLVLTSPGGDANNRPRDGFLAVGSTHGGGHDIIIKNVRMDLLQEGARIQDASNDITFQNCFFGNMVATDETSGNGIFSNTSYINIIECEFYNLGYGWSNGHSHATYFSDVDNFTIQRCIVHHCDNPLALVNDHNGSVESNTIFDCTYAGIDIDDRSVGKPPYTSSNIFVENNLIHDTHRGILIQHSDNMGNGISNITIANNIVYNQDVVGFRVESINAFSTSIIANNTFYNCFEGVKFSGNISISNITLKNNILYNTAYSNGSLLTVNNTSDINNIDLDYNLYYKSVGVDTKIGGTSRTLPEFKLKYASDEQHSISSNPLFMDAANYDFRLQSNSPAIGSGINLGLKDILGNLISGNTDIGAFQYKTNLNQTSGLKIFLEGSFENGIMSTALSDQKIIPLSQPYVSTPWSYSGNERVTLVPQNIVDWVLIELRLNSDASSRVARQAAFVNSNGLVIDISGNNISFNNVADGDYYIVVIQRNHLAVMSAKSVSIKDGCISYDFTTGEDKAYGSNAMANLGDGIFGMYGGDSDSNGIIDDSDVTDVGNSLFNTNYLLSDIDLNCKVNVIDYKYPKKNLGKKTFVTGIFAL